MEGGRCVCVCVCGGGGWGGGDGGRCVCVCVGRGGGGGAGGGRGVNTKYQQQKIPRLTGYLFPFSQWPGERSEESEYLLVCGVHVWWSMVAACVRN